MTSFFIGALAFVDLFVVLVAPVAVIVLSRSGWRVWRSIALVSGVYYLYGQVVRHLIGFTPTAYLFFGSCLLIRGVLDQSASCQTSAQVVEPLVIVCLIPTVLAFVVSVVIRKLRNEEAGAVRRRN
jgi:hypothetical protein